MSIAGGEYRLEKYLGVEGATSLVFLGVAGDSKIAIKIAKPNFDQVEERFRTEYELLTRLQEAEGERHHVVRALDFLPERLPILALELVEGIPVLTLAFREGGLKEEFVLEIGLQYALVLQMAHGCGAALKDPGFDNVRWIEQERGIRVLDWNVVDEPTAEAVRRDIRFLGRLMTRLLTLEEPPPPGSSWEGLRALSLGMRQILMRACHPSGDQAYRNATGIVEALQHMQNSWKETPASLMDRAEAALKDLEMSLREPGSTGTPRDLAHLASKAQVDADLAAVRDPSLEGRAKGVQDGLGSLFDPAAAVDRAYLLLENLSADLARETLEEARARLPAGQSEELRALDRWLLVAEALADPDEGEDKYEDLLEVAQALRRRDQAVREGNSSNEQSCLGVLDGFARKLQWKRVEALLADLYLHRDATAASKMASTDPLKAADLYDQAAESYACLDGLALVSKAIARLRDHFSGGDRLREEAATLRSRQQVETEGEKYLEAATESLRRGRADECLLALNRISHGVSKEIETSAKECREAQIRLRSLLESKEKNGGEAAFVGGLLNEVEEHEGPLVEWARSCLDDLVAEKKEQARLGSEPAREFLLTHLVGRVDGVAEFMKTLKQEREEKARLERQVSEERERRLEDESRRIVGEVLALAKAVVNESIRPGELSELVKALGRVQYEPVIERDSSLRRELDDQVQRFGERQGQWRRVLDSYEEHCRASNWKDAIRSIEEAKRGRVELYDEPERSVVRLLADAEHRLIASTASEIEKRLSQLKEKWDALDPEAPDFGPIWRSLESGFSRLHDEVQSGVCPNNELRSEVHEWFKLTRPQARDYELADLSRKVSSMRRRAATLSGEERDNTLYEARHIGEKLAKSLPRVRAVDEALAEVLRGLEEGKAGEFRRRKESLRQAFMHFNLRDPGISFQAIERGLEDLQDLASESAQLQEAHGDELAGMRSHESALRQVVADLVECRRLIEEDFEPERAMSFHRQFPSRLKELSDWLPRSVVVELDDLKREARTLEFLMRGTLAGREANSGLVGGDLFRLGDAARKLDRLVRELEREVETDREKIELVEMHYLSCYDHSVVAPENCELRHAPVNEHPWMRDLSRRAEAQMHFGDAQKATTWEERNAKLKNCLSKNPRHVAAKTVRERDAIFMRRRDEANKLLQDCRISLKQGDPSSAKRFLEDALAALQEIQHEYRWLPNDPRYGKPWVLAEELRNSAQWPSDLPDRGDQETDEKDPREELCKIARSSAGTLAQIADRLRDAKDGETEAAALFRKALRSLVLEVDRLSRQGRTANSSHYDKDSRVVAGLLADWGWELFPQLNTTLANWLEEAQKRLEADIRKFPKAKKFLFFRMKSELDERAMISIAALFQVYVLMQYSSRSHEIRSAFPEGSTMGRPGDEPEDIVGRWAGSGDDRVDLIRDIALFGGNRHPDDPHSARDEAFEFFKRSLYEGRRGPKVSRVGFLGRLTGLTDRVIGPLINRTRASWVGLVVVLIFGTLLLLSALSYGIRLGWSWYSNEPPAPQGPTPPPAASSPSSIASSSGARDPIGSSTSTESGLNSEMLSQGALLVNGPSKRPYKPSDFYVVKEAVVVELMPDSANGLFFRKILADSGEARLRKRLKLGDGTAVSDTDLSQALNSGVFIAPYFELGKSSQPVEVFVGENPDPPGRVSGTSLRLKRGLRLYVYGSMSDRYVQLLTRRNPNGGLPEIFEPGGGSGQHIQQSNASAFWVSYDSVKGLLR